MVDAAFLAGVVGLAAGLGSLRGRWWALAGALLGGVLVWQLARSRTVALAPIERRGPPTSAVALTLDDGPTAPYTNDVLAQLNRAGARATFFVTGAELAAHPELGARIVAEGHELGNHSWSHDRLWFRSSGWIERELADTDALITAAGQAPPIRFRPPYGKKLLALPLALRRQGRALSLWDVEPDSADLDAEGMVAHTLAHVEEGSVILLHVMSRSRAESRRALPLLLEGLRERGFEVTTMSDLLARRG